MRKYTFAGSLILRMPDALTFRLNFVIGIACALINLFFPKSLLAYPLILENPPAPNLQAVSASADFSTVLLCNNVFQGLGYSGCYIWKVNHGTYELPSETRHYSALAADGSAIGAVRCLGSFQFPCDISENVRIELGIGGYGVTPLETATWTTSNGEMCNEETAGTGGVGFVAADRSLGLSVQAHVLDPYQECWDAIEWGVGFTLYGGGGSSPLIYWNGGSVAGYFSGEPGQYVALNSYSASADLNVVGGSYNSNHNYTWLGYPTVWVNGAPEVNNTSGMLGQSVYAVSNSGNFAAGGGWPNGGFFRWQAGVGFVDLGPTPFGSFIPPNRWSISDDGARIIFSPYYLWDETWGFVNSSDFQSSFPANSYYCDLHQISPSGELALATCAMDTGILSPAIIKLNLAHTEIVDPIPDLMNANQITTDLAKLTYAGRPIQGVSADGVSYAVVRVKSDSDLGSAHIEIVDENNTTVSSATEYGAVAPVLFSDLSFSTLQTDVDSELGADGSYNYLILYRAPENFTRESNYASDMSEAQRRIQLKITYLNGAMQNVPIYIVKPPVALIHGTFANPSVWDAASSLVNDTTLYLYRLDYSGDVDSTISATIPDYSIIRNVQPVKRNTIGVEYNAPDLLDDMIAELLNFRNGLVGPTGMRVAALQTDVVAHSLGGLMARGMTTQNDFYSIKNRNQGYIRRLITLGSTHLGTHHSSHLVSGDSDCTRDRQKYFGMYALTSATISGKIYNGAIFDQVGDGKLENASDAIKKLHTPTLLKNGDMAPGLKTAFLYGERTSVNDSNDVADQCWWLQLTCSDFMSERCSTERWSEIFNDQSNDVIVPMLSATDGGHPATFFSGVVHGPGSVGIGTTLDPHLGFNGPNLLDEDSGVPEKVLELLNAASDSSNFSLIP